MREGSAPLKPHNFSPKFTRKFMFFFDASFWTIFFEIFARLGAKKLDFGSPLAPSWAQSVAQNRPSGVTNHEKTYWSG